MELNLITDDPRSMNWGQITERQTKLLEKEILNHPEFWMWSHKRWKREIPDNLEQLKEEQHAKFNQRFRNN
jgi:KDO2-lipid IV(A) lauroyltransferase